ncbi:MAG: hypothetical protein KTR30_01690 [Saprospiraceae bacterium]|nr:hypothetical protein [Saprospiraceae bacterium]
MEKEPSFEALTDIDQLVQQFVSQTLPREAWTHEAHLLVALWHLYHHSVDEATCLLRSRIISYNIIVGTENSSTSGYHETMTLFWIWVVDRFLQTHEGGLLQLAATFTESKYADRKLPLLFYQGSTLFSVKARARWVEPDLQALDFSII